VGAIHVHEHAEGRHLEELEDPRGPRRFPPEASPGKLARGASVSFDNGVVYTNYRPLPK
jgi:hypothetical protein